MQSLSLNNTLLKKNVKTEKKNLAIITYPAIPMSKNTGLLGWVHNCDTLNQLVVDYRKANHTVVDPEIKLMRSMTSNFQTICLPHKVEIYRYVLENTRGEYLKKILWLKSENAEAWLVKRTNYVRSLATMSMVGYILGLGDRHLSNIMMQRVSGKVVHIDFGDLFEATMKRKDFPERVPFRLTRMLTKAMEACGIEGNYRATCNNVMEVIRENKDSLLAILESFVTDPLLNWRLMTYEMLNKSTTDINKKAISKQDIKQIGLNESKLKIPMESLSGRLEIQIRQNFADNSHIKEGDTLNKKALEAVTRIKAKLQGNDFKNALNLSVEQQVSALISQATSDENISQAYIGWNPFL